MAEALAETLFRETRGSVMEPLLELLSHGIGFGFVIAGMVLAWLIGAALGGWKFGKFLRRVEFTVDRAQLAGFLERLQRRIAELGFTPTGVAGQYLQGGASFQDFGAFTHAKTPKLLNIAMDDSGQSQAKVHLALEYVNWIVADTGEGAYRDAVLDYISGQTEAMKVVPNRSFLAVCTLVGGILAWVALLGLRAVGLPFFEPTLTLGITYFTLWVFAVIAILFKRGQATGRSWAICRTI